MAKFLREMSSVSLNRGRREMSAASSASETREDMLKRASNGEITPEQAEAWAEQNRQPSFASRPDASKFDPMKEAYWTLAMAAAWIIWGTRDAVREHWNSYRAECWDWTEIKRKGGASGDGGWHIEKLRPISLHDICREANSADVRAGRISAQDQVDNIKAASAIDRLWEKLKDGCLSATGIPCFASGGVTLANQPVRTPISAYKWNDLEPFDYHAGPLDSIAGACDNVARYHKVRVARSQVLALWLPDTSENEVRVSASESSPVARRRGRPRSTQAIMDEYSRWAESGCLPPTLKETANNLCKWHSEKSGKKVAPRTIENSIRKLHKTATAQSSKTHENTKILS